MSTTTPSRIIVRLLIAAAAIGIIAYLVRSNTKSSTTAADTARKAAAQRSVPVLIASVEKRDVPIWLEGLGTVAAWQQVTVRPQVEGRLDDIFFKEGQTVKKGDLLAQIDPRPFRAMLQQAEGALARDRAQLLGGKLNLERYKTLLKRQLGSQQQVDDQVALVGQNEGAIRVDQAAVETAKLNLDYARIKAPLTGVVGVRQVDPGNLVRATDPLGVVLIAQIDPAAVMVTLPQDDLPRLSAAMRRGQVDVEAWSRDGRMRLGKGKVAAVDNQINQATATLRLKAELPNPESNLWPNQFVKARLLVDTEREALVVPAASILRGPQGTFAYIVGKDSTVEARPLQISVTTADIVIVTKGVAVGEKIVVEGQNQLRPGAKVTPRPATSAKKADGTDAGGDGTGRKGRRGGARAEGADGGSTVADADGGASKGETKPNPEDKPAPASKGVPAPVDASDGGKKK